MDRRSGEGGAEGSGSDKKEDGVIEAWFDGACEPVNPGGDTSWGWICKKGVTLGKGSGYFSGNDKNTNNVAEYKGLYDLLNWLASRYAKEKIHIYGDSMLVVNQMAGKWRIKGGFYTPTAMKCLEMLELFVDLSFEWVPREMNYEADSLAMGELSKRGIFRHKGRV